MWKLILFLSALNIQAKELSHRVPDEIESVGGHALGFANAGMGTGGDLADVRRNPAMLVMEGKYSLFAGYHWPSLGRSFYQVGAVDAKTSNLAAGLSYSGYHQPRLELGAGDFDKQASSYFDSPIKHRVVLGLGYIVGGSLALGLGGSYVLGEALEQNGDSVVRAKESNGVTMNLGVAGVILPELRFGASVENLANRELEEMAPRTYRLGLAYTSAGGLLTGHADYVRRDRVLQERMSLSETGVLTIKNDEESKRPESLFIASGSVRIQDLLRLVGAYGLNLDGMPRRLWSVGAALVQDGFSISYVYHKPYQEGSEQHAVNAVLQLAM